MPEQRHTKESIIQTLQNIAQQLGKTTLTKQDVQTMISVSNVNYRFGNLGNALEAAGLDRVSPGENFRGRGNVLSDDDLFTSILDVEKALGHEPGCSEYSCNGQFSPRPFKRFGQWNDVLQLYRKWKIENAISVDQAALGVPISLSSTDTLDVSSRDISVTDSFRKVAWRPSLLYGEPINFRGLQHAPINEQGVVYLFGVVSRELGFNVESIQQGFPDCEAKYLYDRAKGLWGRARIEFEFKSSNFREHGHDASQCDFVVCWVHDWADCPMVVIELRSEIMKLPSN